jgi:aminoglycoside phosphotransferase (APT) family kinase protein
MTYMVAAPDAAKAEAALEIMRRAGSVGAPARVTRLHQMEGGWSRHSYAITVEEPDTGERQFVIRVRPPGAILESDLGQEFRTYRLLHSEPVPTPEVHGMEHAEETAFGGPFFVMDRLPGSDPNVWRRRDREALAEDWAGPRGIGEDLVDHLASIHAVRAERVHGAIAARDYQETVDFWHQVQRKVGLVRDPIVEEAYGWAGEHEPDPVEPCLVHGDYRIGNCLVDRGRITGVLDWELSFVGDPRFDLGYISLDYHAGKFVKRGSRLLNGVAERRWFYERYESLTGTEVDAETVRTYAVIGALMLIAILHTGVRVYATGQTTDIRMAWSRFAIPGLRQDLMKLMRWGRS